MFTSSSQILCWPQSYTTPWRLWAAAESQSRGFTAAHVTPGWRGLEHFGIFFESTLEVKAVIKEFTLDLKRKFFKVGNRPTLTKMWSKSLQAQGGQLVTYLAELNRKRYSSEEDKSIYNLFFPVAVHNKKLPDMWRNKMMFPFLTVKKNSSLINDP